MWMQVSNRQKKKINEKVVTQENIKFNAVQPRAYIRREKED